MSEKSNIIELGGTTKGSISPNKVIQAAQEACKMAVIIGYDNDGEFYFASTSADAREVLWLLEKAKKQILTFK